MKLKDYIGDRVFYDDSSQSIFGNKGTAIQKLADIRGWGAIQHLFADIGDATKFQDELGYFIAEAINLKLKENEKGN